VIAARFGDWWSRISLAFVVGASVVAFAMQPKEHRVVVTDTTVTILDEVTFVGDTISTPSLRTLDAIADTLLGNPSIELVEVQSPSLAHARICVDYLIGQGVLPERLDAAEVPERKGIGFLIVKRASDDPTEPNTSDAPRIPANADSIY
jgi:hypothetical protein